MRGLKYTDYFEPEKTDTLYEEEKDAMSELLALLDLYLAAACAKHGWEKEHSGNSGYSEWGEDSAVRSALETAHGHIKSRQRATAEKKRNTRYQYICQCCQLNELQQFALLVSLAPEYDRKYGVLYASLQADKQAVYATPGLVMELAEYRKEWEQTEYRRLYDPNEDFWLCMKQSGLQGVINGAGTAVFRNRPLILQERIVQFMRGNGLGRFGTGTLTGTAQEYPGSNEELYLYQKVYEQMDAAYSRMREDRTRTGILILKGRRGSGKHTMVSKLAAEHYRSVCLIHVSRILEKDVSEREELWREIWLETRISANIFCFDELEGLFLQDQLTAQGQYFLRTLSGLRRGLTFILLTERDLPYNALSQTQKLSLELKNPTPGEKIRLWKQFGKEYKLDQDVDLSLCGSQYVLNAGEIKSLFQTAALLAQGDHREEIRKADIVAAVKQHNSRMLGEYATLVPAVFNWEDLVVEDSVRRQMEHICNQLKYRSVVADDWNFYRKTPYGRGLCALFYGPPGTGKTMAVQVIANELGLDLYRIDLSQMVSKYIGETEKNISALFERAKDINALLFFDEADAFFARRSEVSDSNDRNANAETAHLLQKLEEYEGITVLATNLKDNIDDAFRRRIKFMINFKLPSAATRLELWKKMFPAEAPVDEDVDLEFFADRFELSGSAIKEIVFNAAYMAAAEHTRIGNRHVIEALRMNFEKLGKTLTRDELDYMG